MGSYVDAICGYSIIAFSFVGLGVAAFHTEGVFIHKGAVIAVILGAFASILDIYARLIYQRYLVALTENGMPIDDEKEDDNKTKSLKSKINYFRKRIGKEIGISGAYMPALIISAIFNVFDVILIFYFLFNLAAFCASFLLYVKRAQDIDNQ
ncbi:hypothetical protein SDC9_210960 [bioreactor metagenome]|uniref:Uncharacterized protein n=1 Tax=bioreactor metagenome TaxID=1076179 RepID=A0A645JHP0_9ZZZZ